MNWPSFVTFGICTSFICWAFGWQVAVAYVLGMVALKALLIEMHG